MNTNFSWLHLTDFHQGMDEQSWLWPGVKQRFFEDLEKLHDKSEPWDLVLFTGDLTNRGSAKEFQKLNQVLEELWEQFDKLGSSPKLLAVPGNHDLVRPNKKDPSVKLLRYWNDDPEVQREFWENADSPYRKVVTEAFKNYTDWLDWLKKQPFKVDNLKNGILPGDFSITFKKGDAKLGIVGLNSTFLQLTSDDYKGKLALHTRQFQAACDGNDGPDWAKQHHVCLLLTHQPPSWLDAHSQQHLNGEIADRGRFAAHLCGHMHDTVFRDISEGGAEAKRIWQGRSLFGLEFFEQAGKNIQRLHGYTVGKIELNEDKGALIFWPRDETELQGGQREIVPDQSIKLIDNQHTIPREFNLFNSLSQNNNDKDRQVRQISQHDIFISYAHVDNEPLPGVDKGWVTTLINGLKIFLGQQLGCADAYSLWMDDEERGNTEVTPHIIKQIKNAATFLLILSPGYLKSQWCRSELKQFLTQVGENSDRVFVVERDEVERAENISNLLGYKFWVKDGGKTYTLATPEPNPKEIEYYQKLDDLARQLKIKIEQEVTLPSHKIVFLALVSADLEEYRNEIKRYLEQQNVQILPTKRYSLRDNDFQQQLKQDLKQCNLFVQLLSEKMGNDWPKSQYEYASAIDDLPILQWHDNTLDLNKVIDPAHKDLLSQNTVIASTLVDFKKHIFNDLKKPEISEEQTKRKENLVFINAAPDDVLLADQIKDFLQYHNISCRLPLPSNTSTKPKKIQQDLDKRLLQCHSVILVYDNATEHWVCEQVRYCQHIQVKRTQPFKIVTVYNKLFPNQQQQLFPNQQQLLSCGLPLNILECVTPQDKDCLPKFVQILTT
jgi:predicted MPP superfamily phosphohydrolase